MAETRKYIYEVKREKETSTNSGRTTEAQGRNKGVRRDQPGVHKVQGWMVSTKRKRQGRKHVMMNNEAKV